MGWMLVRYPSFFENMYWNGGGYRDGCNVYQSAKAQIKIFSQSLNLLYTKFVVILRNGWCVRGVRSRQALIVNRTDMKKEVVILSAKRTPIGSFGGALKGKTAADLGVVAAKAAIAEAGICPSQIDQVMFGCVLQAGVGQNVARQVGKHSGLEVTSPALTVNQVCGSGMKSIILGAMSIMCEDTSVVLVGGTESMSNAPYISPDARWGARMGDAKLVDAMIKDGLWDAFNDVHMGVTAENVAERFGITREMQDALACESQRRACLARKNGEFKREIAPVEIVDRKGKVTVVADDEYPREGVTMESLAQLKPAFKKGGTVTAGNASGINDGAAALIIASREKAEALGLKPLASIVGFAAEGVEPDIMGVGPIASTKKVMQRTGMSANDFDITEANEAFAAQAACVVRELGFDMSRVNLRGGAIALGHPIGASGARIVTTLLHLLQDKKKEVGLATLCVGGGMGLSIVIKAE